MENLETYVINLERRKDRLENFLDRFPGCGNAKKINILKAVDGRNLESSGGALYKEFLNSLKARNLKPWINTGEIGCLLSHLSIWNKIIDENIPYALIYEDDALFAENYIHRLKKVVAEIPEDALVIYIGGRDEPNFKTKNSVPVSANVVKHRKDVDWRSNQKDLDRWLHAYVITKNGASVMKHMIFNEYSGKLGVDHAVILKLRDSPQHNTYSASELLCYSVIVGDSDIRNWNKAKYCKFTL